MCDQKNCTKGAKAAAPVPPSPLSCSTVMGIAFDTGVILAADTLVSYEGLALFTNARRVLVLNDRLLLAGGNNYADFQYVQSAVEEKCQSDPTMDPLSLQTFLRSGMYNKCIKDKAIRVDLLLGGLQHDRPYLCRIDHRGYVIREQVAATGPVANMILPFLNKELEKRNAKMSLYNFNAEGDFRARDFASGETVAMRPNLADTTENSTNETFPKTSIQDKFTRNETIEKLEILDDVSNGTSKQRLDENTAKQLVRSCMEILYRRHTMGHPVYYMGIVDERGARLERVNLLEG